jgi:flagellin
MGLTINATSYTWNTGYYLNRSIWDSFKALEKLSSGFRINSAADDPAGLVISVQLRSSIATLNQEIKNLSANIGKYETTSSVVQNLRSDLTELRSLAVGAANDGGNSEASQQAFADAANALINTYNGTITNAEYNGSKTLDGSEGSLASIAPLEGLDLSTPEGAAQALDKIDAAASNLDSVLGDLGAKQRYELEARLDNLQVTRQNLIAAESQIRDASFFDQYSNFVASQIRTKAALALMAHSYIVESSVLDLFRSH